MKNQTFSVALLSASNNLIQNEQNVFLCIFESEIIAAKGNTEGELKI